MRSDKPALDKKLAAAKVEYAAMPAASAAPGAGALAELQRRVSMINKLKMGKSSGVTNVLATLEKITMDGIYLTEFTYNLEDNGIQIEARTDSASKMSDFLGVLEKEPLFNKVSLEKQSQRETSMGAKTVDFSIKAVESTP